MFSPSIKMLFRIKRIGFTLRINLCILEIGILSSKDMDMGFMSGLMDLNILGIGSLIWLVVMGKKSMLMGMFMKEIGKKIRQMERESIESLMGLSIKENGKIIYLMDKGLRSMVKMKQFLKEYFIKEKSKVLENSVFQTEVISKENSMIISQTDKEGFNGLMVRFMKEIGF